jgi:hypothetical protein
MKLRRDNIPRTQAISRGIEFTEEVKVEAFETLKIFQGEGRSLCSRRSYNFRWIDTGRKDLDR